MNDRSTPRPASGRCLCEEVTYEVHGQLRPVVNCHCSRCRRSTGHFLAATACRRADLRLLGDETLKWYEVEGRAYGFCARCGSTLFWKAEEFPDRISIAAGTLDLPTGLETVESIFVGSASDYHQIDPSIPSFEDRPPRGSAGYSE